MKDGYYTNGPYNTVKKVDIIKKGITHTEVITMNASGEEEKIILPNMFLYKVNKGIVGKAF